MMALILPSGGLSAGVLLQRRAARQTGFRAILN